MFESDTNVDDSVLNHLFYLPNMNSENHSITSPSDSCYNCIAWITGDQDFWWSPFSIPGSYWPEGIPREDKLDTYIRLFKYLGYELCDNFDYEENCEKIAIYTDLSHEKFMHVAKQKNNDLWLSKLGEWEDIEHTLDALENPIYYGKATIAMKKIKKKKKSSSKSPPKPSQQSAST